MEFIRTQNKNKPVFMYLHSELLTPQSFTPCMNVLKKKYTVVTPVLDGHGSQTDLPVANVQKSASEILEYIDREYNGHVSILSGLSLGAVTVLEVLAQRPDVCDFALLESPVLTPPKIHGWSTGASLHAEKLARQNWFNKFMYYERFNSDGGCIDFNANYQKMTQENIIAAVHNAENYALPEQLKDIQCKTAILIGQTENKRVKQSADRIVKTLPNVQTFMLRGCGHGDFSLGSPRDMEHFVKDFVLGRENEKPAQKQKDRQPEGEYMPNWKHIRNKMRAKKARRAKHAERLEHAKRASRASL
ncbi:MAG: alpha/beta fold hydrolase [Eubacteriaceae bacterium]|jgi:pimeloyl-ACP methyl ester carboxylesterase